MKNDQLAGDAGSQVANVLATMLRGLRHVGAKQCCFPKALKSRR